MTRFTVRQLLSEAVGSFFLFATVIGSGIMAEALASGNVAVALLGNTMATGAMLFVLIAMLGPISGAHFNPAVSLVAWLRKEMAGRELAGFVVVQIVGGCLGVWATHAMFDLPVLQFSTKARSGMGQWTGEFIATFGLVLTILGTVRMRPALVSASLRQWRSLRRITSAMLQPSSRVSLNKSAPL